MGQEGQEIGSEVASESWREQERDGGECGREMGDGEGVWRGRKEWSGRRQEVLQHSVLSELWKVLKRRRTRFLDQVDHKNRDLRLPVEALRRGEVADRLDVKFGARHALYDGERGERDRVPEHLELSTAKWGRRVSKTATGRTGENSARR